MSVPKTFLLSVISALIIAASFTASPATSTTKTFEVQSTVRISNTIKLLPGQRALIIPNPNSTWNVWGPGRGALGYGGLVPVYGHGAGYPAPNNYQGALIVYQNNQLSHVFSPQEKYILINKPGLIGFGPNDNRLDDNTGYIEVYIILNPTAEDIAAANNGQLPKKDSQPQSQVKAQESTPGFLLPYSYDNNSFGRADGQMTLITGGFEYVLKGETITTANQTFQVQFTNIKAIVLAHHYVFVFLYTQISIARPDGRYSNDDQENIFYDTEINAQAAFSYIQSHCTNIDINYQNQQADQIAKMGL
jgi:hypothetical protein